MSWAAFPQRHLAEFHECIEVTLDGEEVVASQRTGLAGKVGAAVRDQDLRFTDPAGIEQDLAGRRIGRGVFIRNARLMLAHGYPAWLRRSSEHE